MHNQNLDLSLLGELITEQLDLASEVVQEAPIEGFTPTTVTIPQVTPDLVPCEIRNLFIFLSAFAAQAEEQALAKGICLAVFAVRLDKNGNLTTASPSIKGAATGATGKFIPGGNWGERATIMPDLYVEADFYSDGEVVVPVPTMLKEPYPQQSGNVSIQLSSANKSLDNWMEYHDSARAEFQGICQSVAQELAIPVGEQFLVCLVGFTRGSKAYENEKNSFWRAFLDGGYIVGGRRVGNSKVVPKALAGLQVKANFTIGGRSISERLAQQVMQARKAAPAAAPARSGAPASAPRAAAPPAAAPRTTAPAPAAPAAEQSMAAAGIFAKLQANAAAAPAGNQFALLDDEDEDELPPAAPAPAGPAANPFAGTQPATAAPAAKPNIPAAFGADASAPEEEDDCFFEEQDFDPFDEEIEVQSASYRANPFK